MPDEVRAYEPSLRERISAALAGDSKPGSIRSHLVRGMFGSSVGDDEGIVGYTPLGAAFKMQAAERDQRHGGTGLRNTLEGAAGLIPGAGPEAHAAITEFVDRLAKEAPEKLEHLMSLWDAPTADHLIKSLHGSDSPSAIKGMMDEISKNLDANKLADKPVNQVRNQLEAASVGKQPQANADAVKPEKLTPKKVDTADTESQLHDWGNQAREMDREHSDPLTSIRKNAISTKGGQSPVDAEFESNMRKALDSGDPEALEAAFGHDPHKLNFIKNAMDDEGGNIPEEVSMSYIDHLMQKRPEALENLMVEHNINPSTKEQELDELAQRLSATHSIPELLGMHYDLNPKVMGNAYKTRPTQ